MEPSQVERHPETARLLGLAARSIMEVGPKPELVMERGEGMYLFDTDGRRYLDFLGGWAVNCLGHAHPELTRALQEQAARLLNASPAFYNRPMLEYADRLVAHTVLDRVWFGSTGAEANEGAIKLARKYGAVHPGEGGSPRTEIITTLGGFHGRTLATMSASGKAKWRELFEPKVPGFRSVPLNDVAALREAVTDQTVAILFEPIQGEGGVFAASEEFVRAARELCDFRNMLLIFDEVQTGFARAGRLFAYELYARAGAGGGPIEPDVLTLGKGIGGGFPLAALLAKEHACVFEPGDQGGTYSGQPLAMAAGQAVLDSILEARLWENAEASGRYLRERLDADPRLTRVRGAGLLVGADLDGSIAAATAKRSGAENLAQDVVATARAHGLLINSPQPGMLRFIPPLIASKDHVDEMMAILTKALDRVLD